MVTKKQDKPDASALEAQFHNKYRPKTLDRVIGQDALVQRLKGIIASGRVPSTMLFTGPPGMGKTTLPRCFAADLFEVKAIKHHPDFHEINGAAEGNIDNIRAVMRMARLKPRMGKRRIILIDECHGLSGASLEAVLKPLEEPPPLTLFILGTSEPEKLKNSMKTRGSPFALKPYTREELIKYAKRIVKAESMDYMTDELVAKVVENANGVPRTICQLLEAIVQGAGNGKIKDVQVEKILSTVETDDAKVAMNVLFEAYSNNIHGVYRNLLDVTDGVRFNMLLLAFNSFLINATVLKGEKHRSVWWNKNNKDLWEAIKESGKITVRDMSVVQHYLLAARSQFGSFGVTEQQIIGDALFQATSRLQQRESK